MASAVGQNAYGPDFLNLHCTIPDPLAQTLFNIQPRPGLVPDRSPNGNVIIYCDAPTGTLKASFSGAAYNGIFAPTGIATGSQFVSNGIGQSGVYQLKPTIDLRDISGIDCTGVADSSSTLATLFVQQKEYVLAAGSAVCNIKLSSTVEPASAGAWAMHGFAGSGGFGAGNLITCSMSATPCLWFDRQRDSDFGQVNINVGSASAGLQISQMGNTSGQISTNNHWHDMYFTNIGSGNSGIVLGPAGDSTSNNELQSFSNIGLSSPGTQVGTGFNTAQALPNCRDVALHDVSTNSLAIGYTFGCGSMYMIGGLQESNVLDFSGNPTNHNLGGGFIARTHSESSKQWLASFGITNPFGFLFNRNEMNLPDLTKFQWDLGLTTTNFISIGNMWGANANVTKMVTLSTQGGNWISIGDVLPNNTKANLPDLSHMDGTAFSVITSNKYSGTVVVSNGGNGNLGTDVEASGIYLLANDTADGGSNQSFYTSPGFDISAVFINSGGTKVFVPWRMVVTGQQPTGANPTATLSFKIDNDPITGIAPATTGALGMDFSGGVANGGTLKLPGGSANKVVCWKADAKSIGFCSTQPDATGACTCN